MKRTTVMFQNTQTGGLFSALTCTLPSVLCAQTLVPHGLLLLYSKKSCCSQRFLSRQISSTIDFTTTRLCKARGRLVLQTTALCFLGEVQFQIFTQEWLLGNIKYFASFKLKSLKSNGFSQNIAAV